MSLLFGFAIDSELWHVCRLRICCCCYLPEWKGVCAKLLGNVASFRSTQNAPTCSVKQANQNELEIMCRCGMWHAKLEASYVYNTGTHSYITSLITGRTHLTSLERVQISLRVLWQCFVVVCLAGCVTILMKVQKLCKTNNMNNCKSSRKALCQCVPIQLNENCTCSCTNRTKRTVLM